MLERIFLKVIDMNRAASLIIVIVFIARMLLKRFPKYISYMLWSVVIFRLLCPVTPELKISPVPNLKPIFYEYETEKDAVSAEETGGFAVPYTGSEAKNVPQIGQDISIQAHTDISGQELFILFGKYAVVCSDEFWPCE